MEFDCQICKYYKNGYCECLELKPSYPAIGCDFFENKGDKEWVPVLDGPPSKDGRYYVTLHDFVTQTDFTDILWYEEGVWWKKVIKYGFRFRQAIEENYAVIAWQLLPEPYKAESEDEE